MLEYIRSRTNSPIVKILFLGILLSFMGLGGAGIFGSSRNYVAKVNGEKIPEELVRREFEYELAQIDADSLSEETLKAYKYRALERVINQKLIEQKIADWGFSVTDLDVLERLQEMPNFHNQKGEFDPELYKEILRSNGIDSVAYENGLRHEIAIRRVQQDLLMGTIIPNDTAEKWAAIDNEERDVELATIYYNQYNNEEISVTTQEVEMMYEANKANHKTDPKVKLAYIDIELDKIESANFTQEEIDYSTETFIAALDKDEELKKSVDRAETRLSDQLFIEFSNDEEKASAKKRLDELSDKIKTGELTFQDIVDNQSDYEGLQYFSNGNLSRGIVSEEAIDNQLFSLTMENSISNPFETAQGVHIVRLQNIGVSRDDAIATLVKQEMRFDHYADLTADLSNLASQYPFDIRKVAEELGLELVETDWLSLTKRDSILAHQEVFNTVNHDIKINDKETEASHLMELVDGSHGMYLNVVDFEDSRTMTLEEAYSAIETDILNNKKREALDTIIVGIQDDLIADPSLELSALAKEKGFNFDRYRGLTRLNVAEVFGVNSLENAVVENAFSTTLADDELAFFVTNENEQGVGLARVSNIVEGTIADYQGPEKEYREYFERQTQMQLELSAFLEGIREESTITYHENSFFN